jgi:hypothetical protein
MCIRDSNPTLLELVIEEFDLYSSRDIRPNVAKREQTYRLAVGGRLGPATSLYFGIVNSGPFVDLLTRLTGIENLVVDHSLFGGGLHETRNGGKFGIHRDFDTHPRTKLENRMVFITYLNKGWNPAWGGALELWDAESKVCVTKVEPEFGHSVLMLNGHSNFHGHPLPLSAPDATCRRSIAAYFYSNTNGALESDPLIGSVFLTRDVYDKGKAALRSCVPPALWTLGKKLLKRT